MANLVYHIPVEDEKYYLFLHHYLWWKY